MDALAALACEHGIRVIEDCAQAHGATYRGRPVGSLGDAACFSFCQDKIVAAGEGGLVALDDDDAYSRAWEYKDHGKSLAKLSDPEFMSAPASFRWVHDSFGSNFRMPELEAAMARVALRELPAAHARRTELAHRLAAGLDGVTGIRIPLPALMPSTRSTACTRTWSRQQLAAGWDRDRVLFAIAAEGVPVQYGSCAELYREAAFVRRRPRPWRALPGGRSRPRDVACVLRASHARPTPTSTTSIAAVRKVMEVAAA